jgi:hypothetical protein
MEAYQEPMRLKIEWSRPIIEFRVSLMRISIRSLIEVKSRIRSFMEVEINPDPHGSENVDPELHGKSKKWIRIRMEAKSQHWLFNLSAGERWT